MVKIRYFNCPVNQQEDPQAYADQSKFFKNLRQTPFLELHLGKLVKRGLKKIDINCVSCKHQKAEHIICPQCKKQIQIMDCYKSWEKGVDVQLAIYMIIDALTKKYDTALLFSGDADFCPAIRYIVKGLNKEVIYCCFPTPKTSELIQTCSKYQIITKEIILKSMANHPQ
ncbi:NYN domain-containing protein [Candidatus Woesearchaeota archaeon]|nr:NYN domain-containing protein [Candidatus Woesearchaeota archaeon]